MEEDIKLLLTNYNLHVQNKAGKHLKSNQDNMD